MKEVVSLRITRSPKIIVTAVVLGLVAAGGAFAFWTAGGIGGTSAEASSASIPLTVMVGSEPLNLTPGGVAVPQSIFIQNKNDSAIRVVSVTAKVSAVRNSPTLTQNPAKPACTPADFSVLAPDGTDTLVVNRDVAAGPAGFIVVEGYSVSLKNTGANQDNCRGAIADYYYTVE